MVRYEVFPVTFGGTMTPDGAIARIAARQHGAFSRAQAFQAGFTREAIACRVKAGRWIRLYRGVYAIAGVPRSHEQRVIAAVLSLGPHAVAASITAGHLHGMLEKPTDLVYVAMPNGQHRRTRKGLVIAEATLTHRDVRKVQGIPVTGPERTIVDAAGVLTTKALESVLDDAIQCGLTTVPRLRRYIRERNLGNRPGAKALRELLDDRTKGVPQQELERMFVRKLRASGLPEPVRQHPVGNRKIDFAYPDAQIAIELDGLRDHFSAAAFRSDRRRQNELVLAGFTLLRFTWEDVDERWPTVEATIRRALPN
jgi:very-short-patch-repair endonuclease